MILDKEKQWFRRKVKESLYINLKNKRVKIDTLMNIEKGVEIDTGWNSIMYDDEFASRMERKRRDIGTRNLEDFEGLEMEISNR